MTGSSGVEATASLCLLRQPSTPEQQDEGTVGSEAFRVAVLVRSRQDPSRQSKFRTRLLSRSQTSPPSDPSLHLSWTRLLLVSCCRSPSAMGQSTSQPVQHQQTAMTASSHPPSASGSSTSSPPPECPMHQKTASQAPAKCPVSHSSSDLNPHNNMPVDLSSSPAPHQTVPLPTERVISSIPRPATPDESAVTGKWEYPSPQQFYNALVRKGWETPEENIETMVEIHNFLNEEAWNEVLKWEKRAAPE